jgi:hypothetical protein
MIFKNNAVAGYVKLYFYILNNDICELTYLQHSSSRFVELPVYIKYGTEART